MKIQISLLVVLLIFCAGCAPVITPTVPPTTITPVLVTPTSAPTDVPLPRQIYLSELPPFFSQVGAWAFSSGVFPASEAAMVKGGIIQSAGKEYPQGLFAHAYSWLDYELDGQYQTFNSDILIQDSADCSDGANFYVFVDGEEAYRQMGMLPGDAPRSIEVDVQGGMHLWLIADSASGNNNCDWTIWGDPMLTTTLSQPSQLLSDSKGLERWLEEYVNAYGGQLDGKDAAAWKVSILNDPQQFTRQKILGGKTYVFLMVQDVPLAYLREDGQWVRLTLRTLADLIPIPIGTNLGTIYPTDLGWRDALVVREFNAAVIDQVALWESEQSRGVFTFGSADMAVNIANTYGMEMMGADLVYGPGNHDVPWLRQLMNLPRAEQIEMMNNHIIEVTQHYQGKIGTWRVANEFRRSTDPDVNDIYARTIGDVYVEMAFQTARAQDPAAILIYNENTNETRSGYYYQHTKQVVDELNAQGLIDGVGMQMHIIYPERTLEKEELVATMQSYGLPVYITELDVDLINLEGTPASRYARQAEIYGTIVAACLESGVCKGIYFWEGFGDSYNWFERMSDDWRFGPAADATIFFDDMRPKPAYYAIQQTLFEHIAWDNQ